MIGAALIPASKAVASPEPGINIFHVAYDNAELVGFGTYTGLPNPNYQRLTLVLSHTFVDTPTRNHFHRIGAYSYTGDIPADPTMLPEAGFSGNNRVPEPYQMDDGLSLIPGEGVFDGKLISGLAPTVFPQDEIEQEYGNTSIRPIDDLVALYDGEPDPDGIEEFHPGHYLVNASRGAYKESVADVTVGLKLVGLTPGLTIHDASGGILMDAVDQVATLGPGNDWVFDPVFAIDSSAPVGSTYDATFILQDLGATGYGDSAEFTFSFVAVPEPTAAVLGAIALAGVAARRR